MTTLSRKMKRRQFLACAASSVLAAPSAMLSRGAYAQSAQQTLAIGLLRAPASAIVDLTERNGWFREAGLTLKEELFAAAAGPKIIQALGGGAIGLSFVNSTAALLGMAGGAIPLRFVSIPTDPSRNFCLLSSPDIASVPNLAGRKVSAPAGTALHYFLGRVLTKHGMTLKDVEFVNLPAADSQAAFVAGRVDAIVPTVNGRYYILNAKKDAKELFGYEDWAKTPSPQGFLNYDLFVTTEDQIAKNRAALRTFLAAYHDRGVVYLLDPKTRATAVKTITDYVNAEQKVPTDQAIMNQIIYTSRFYDAKTTKALMMRDDFRASLETQVKFFMDLKQMPSAPDLSRAIVTDLL